MTSSRFVLDTNVLVSATLFRQGKPARVFRKVLAIGELLVSLTTLEELRNVLNRRKFDRYIKPEDKKDFLTVLVNRSILINPVSKISACRDPKDNQILELAVDGKASFIITGDDDLLVLNPFQNV
ncbi:MAG: putative toxin-antitoxin system toxin component, PIN family [Cyanobacteria bacterium J06626_18]